MTQEDKELLLKDLCGRLPFGVKVDVNQSELQNYDYKWKNWNFDEEPQEIDGVSIYGVTFGCMDMSDGVIGFEYIKPYLFPLSSMTEEQTEELIKLINTGQNDNNEFMRSLCRIDFYHRHHLDYRNLIPMGLANDSTGLNIY